MTSSEMIVQADMSGTVVRRVRAAQSLGLGGVLQKSLGPEAIPAKRSWKETLGWDDSFEPADTEMRVSELA